MTITTAALAASIREEVIAPWHEACRESNTPWEVPDGLMVRWEEKMWSELPLSCVTGAFGLLRASNTPRHLVCQCERQLLLHIQGLEMSPLSFCRILLSGGSPPPNLVFSILDANCRKECVTAEALILVTQALKHPCLAAPPPSRAKPEMEFYLRFRSGDFSGFAESFGSWTSACATLHAPNPPPLESLDSPLERLALCFRFDRSPTISETISLPGDWHGLVRGHPARNRSPLATFQRANPSAAAIRFFSGADYISGLWRYCNPLLIAPWLVEAVTPEASTSVLCAAGLLGAPSLLFKPLDERPPSEASRSAYATHPSISLLEFLARE